MLLLKNGTIHNGLGEVLENHDILIGKDSIRQIARNIDYPGVPVISCSGCHILPGIIEPLSGMGCIDYSIPHKDNEESTDPITPELKAKYAFNPAELQLQELYKSGTTSIGVVPGNENIIGGQVAVFKTYGCNTHDMLVKDGAALKASVTGSVKESYGGRKQAPMTRMGIFSMLECALREAVRYTGEGEAAPGDKKREILRKVLRKEMPIFVSVNRKQEVDALMEVLKDYDIDLVLCNGFQLDRCEAMIMKKRPAIIMGNHLYASKWITEEMDLVKFAAYINDDISISLSSSSDVTPGDRESLLWNAIDFYKIGVDAEKVIQLLTLNPAKALGIDDRVGSIEVGKEADLAVFSGHPIKTYSAKTVCTIIRGEVVYSTGGKGYADN